MIIMSDKENEKEVQEVNLEDLEKVTGGTAFGDVPRVPEKAIDDSLKSKV
jgi:hypothetical protein